MYSSLCYKHLTATGTHVPYGITQCYLPPGRGDIPAFTRAVYIYIFVEVMEHLMVVGCCSCSGWCSLHHASSLDWCTRVWLGTNSTLADSCYRRSSPYSDAASTTLYDLCAMLLFVGKQIQCYFS